GTPPWVSTTRGTIQFSTNDALASPDSGAGLVVNIVNATSINGGGVDSECVPVSPSATYGIYSRYLMASGQPGGDVGAAAWTTVSLFSDSSCTAPSSGQSG